MRKALRIPLEELEKRNKRYELIYQKYKNSSLEELKIAFNSKEHKSSTDRRAIGQLTFELQTKEKGLNEPITNNTETTENVVGNG